MDSIAKNLFAALTIATVAIFGFACGKPGSTGGGSQNMRSGATTYQSMDNSGVNAGGNSVTSNPSAAKATGPTCAVGARVIVTTGSDGKVQESTCASSANLQ